VGMGMKFITVSFSSYCTLGMVSIWMGDHRQTSKTSQFVISYASQLSLAIPRVSAQ